MSVSVCVAFRNDPFIRHTIDALLKGVEFDRFEILVYDDASDEPIEPTLSQFPNVRVLRGSSQRGVGYGFDTLVKEAKYETIVLMGSDVIVKDPSWLDIVSEYVSKYPKGIGCSTCLSGDPYHLDPLNPADNVKRYGARMYPYVTTEQLPSDSPLLQDTNQYVIDLFDGKWFKTRPEENINEVPRLMGAMYACSKSWYNHIGGWDMLHKAWGGLESYISLKSWLMGGSIHNIRDLETMHIWSKYETPANGRTDYAWFNKMAIAYTMMPEDLAKRLIAKVYFLRVQNELYTLPFNLGRKLISKNWDQILKVRDRNDLLFEHDFDWFCEKFGIEVNF